MILHWTRIPETPDGSEQVASRVEVCELVQRLFPRVVVTLDRVTFVAHDGGWQVNLHGYGPVGRLS
jgi:hypothetical protein